MTTNTPIDESTTPSRSTDPLDQFSDAELLDAWTRDELAAALSVLIQRHSAMVLSVCRRKCRSAVDADDAFQTTFLALARNSSKIKRPECLAGWLHRVAQRASVATLTQHASENESTETCAMIDNPLERITQQHDANVVDEELSALPEQYRSVLVMKIHEEHSLEKLAEHFQTTLGTIRGRLQRGKKLLANRLRRRGVVPVVAVAAATSTMVSASEATAAGANLMNAFSNSVPPASPIPDHLLHPLFTTGKTIMTPWNIAGSLAAAGAIAVLLIAPGFGSDSSQASRSPSQIISIAAAQDPVVAQFAAPQPQDSANAAKAPETAGTSSTAGTGGASSATPAPGTQPSTTTAVQSGNAPSGNTRTVIQHRFRPAIPSGPLVSQIKKQMDEPAQIALSGTVEDLSTQLEDQLGVPVIMSDRVLKYAEIDPASKLTYQSRQEPLRTALRKALSPLGLKATIESEGMVITANHSQLVHKGIGTDQWLTVNDQQMRDAVEKLQTPFNQKFIQSPLSEVVEQISQAIDLPMVLDLRGLEEIGLNQDATVSSAASSGSTYNALSMMLRDLDCELTWINNMATVTTREASEDELMGRIYWLEGIGVGGDLDGIMALIETSIEPDAWEALGGNCTMVPSPGNRPGLVVNAPYDLHRRIEQLLKVLRENSFAPDAIAEQVEVTVPALNNDRNRMGGGMSGGFM